MIVTLVVLLIAIFVKVTSVPVMDVLPMVNFLFTVPIFICI